MSTFAPGVVTAVCAHMNGDHTDDNLRIVQAFGRPEASAAALYEQACVELGVQPAAH